VELTGAMTDLAICNLITSVTHGWIDRILVAHVMNSSSSM